MDIDMKGIGLQSKEFDAVAALAKRYRALPPIVDDDYPEARHYYECAIRNLIDALIANGRMKAAPPPATPRGDGGELDAYFPELLEAASAHECERDSMDVCRHCETVAYVKEQISAPQSGKKEESPLAKAVKAARGGHAPIDKKGFA